MSEREPLDELRSLLGVWYTDSPTWPPAPGIAKALRLLDAVERQHLETIAVYIGEIKAEAAARRDERIEDPAIRADGHYRSDWPR